MKATGKCPKCGSDDIIKNAKAVDRAHGDRQKDMILATFRDPAAMVFKGRQVTSLSAWVCASCAFVELYADSPADLKVEE